MVDSSLCGFEDPFVVIGIAAVVAVAFLGIRIFGPLARQTQQAHSAENATTLGRACRRFMAFRVLDVAIFTFAVIAMATKLGT